MTTSDLDNPQLHHAAATSIQSLWRAFRVRKLFPRIEMDFEAIVQEIEGEEGFQENCGREPLGNWQDESGKAPKVERRVLVQWRDFECFGRGGALRRPEIGYAMSGGLPDKNVDSNSEGVNLVSRGKAEHEPSDEEDANDSSVNRAQAPNIATPKQPHQKLKYFRPRPPPPTQHPAPEPPKDRDTRPIGESEHILAKNDQEDEQRPSKLDESPQKEDLRMRHTLHTPSKPPFSTSPPSKSTPGPHSSDIHVDSNDLFVKPTISQTPDHFRKIVKKSFGDRLNSSLNDSRDSFDDSSDDDDVRMSTAMSQFRKSAEAHGTTLDDFLRMSKLNDTDKEKLAHQVELLITEEALKKRKAILRKKARQQMNT